MTPRINYSTEPYPDYSTKYSDYSTKYSTKPSVSKPSEIEQTLLKLDNSVQILQEQLNNLEDKLSPITRIFQPIDKDMISTESTEYNTKIAQQINGYARSIEKMNERIIDLRNRIEL